MTGKEWANWPKKIKKLYNDMRIELEMDMGALYDAKDLSNLTGEEMDFIINNWGSESKFLREVDSDIRKYEKLQSSLKDATTKILKVYSLTEKLRKEIG